MDRGKTVNKGKVVGKHSDEARQKMCNIARQHDSEKSKESASVFFAKAQKVIVGDEELSKDSVRLLSLVFMIIALILGLLNYGQPNLPWVSQWITYRPTLVTTLYSLALVLPLYVRGVLKWYGFTIFSILSFLLNVLVTAVLISMLLGGQSTIEYKIFSGVRIPFGGQESSNTILMIAIILSWLGMRIIAGLAWVFVFVFTVFNISTVNSVLGMLGALFIVFSFLGIVLQNNLTPALLYSELKNEFSGRGENIRSDINESAKFTGKVVKSAAKNVI